MPGMYGKVIEKAIGIFSFEDSFRPELLLLP